MARLSAQAELEGNPDACAPHPLSCFRGSRAVSSAVSLSQHSVDLWACCYDTDAQDLAGLLLGVVTRLANDAFKSRRPD